MCCLACIALCVAICKPLALLTRPTTGTGKLHRKYDESLAQIAEQQKSGNKLFVLDDADYAKRVNVERELDRTPDTPPSNVVFDDSSNFIIYPTLLGIKSAAVFE